MEFELRFCFYAFMHGGELISCDECPFPDRALCDIHTALINSKPDEEINDEE